MKRLWVLALPGTTATNGNCKTLLDSAAETYLRTLWMWGYRLSSWGTMVQCPALQNCYLAFLGPDSPMLWVCLTLELHWDIQHTLCASPMNGHNIETSSQALLLHTSPKATFFFVTWESPLEKVFQAMSWWHSKSTEPKAFCTIKSKPNFACYIGGWW